MLRKYVLAELATVGVTMWVGGSVASGRKLDKRAPRRAASAWTIYDAMSKASAKVNGSQVRVSLHPKLLKRLQERHLESRIPAHRCKKPCFFSNAQILLLHGY